MNASLQKSGLHRYAILLVIVAMAVIIAGAFITSTEVAARQSETTVSAVVNVSLHRALAIALAVLTLGLALGASFEATAGWVKAAAWSGLAIVACDGVLGWAAPPLSPNLAVFHALLAHLFLTLITVFALGTSSGWRLPPELVDGSSKPLLRLLAIATPPVVFLQITLGSMYRHDMTSILPHIAIAMGVAFLGLIGSSVVLQNFPRPASLRRAAAAFISIVLTQVCLGIGAFLMLVLNYAGTLYFVLTTVGHVAIGAATLAASVIMAMEVWRSVLPKKRVDQRTE
jgi:heme A synthase